MESLEDFEKTKKKPKSQMKATKDYKLLSFGDEAEDLEDDLETIEKVKVKSSHDVLNDPKLSKDIGTIEKLDKNIEKSDDLEQDTITEQNSEFDH